MTKAALVILALVVAAGGCGHKPTGAAASTAPGPRGQGRGAPCSPAGQGGGLLPAEGAACVDSPCVYHGGSDGYFRCLSGALGACFHFGAPCAPSHRCMLNRETAEYRLCDKLGEGRCRVFGAACEPPGRCMYNPEDRLHHRCEELSSGTCKRFGPVCDPW